MEKKAIIYDKLEGFIKKFYTNELIKGIILFIAIGLLYFIFTFLMEYFLWFSTQGRTILFWLFIAVEVLLLSKFIMLPLFKLFKIQKGLDYTEASKIIGTHFDEVKDKLLNFLQLANTKQPSELVLASIEQKANTLQPIPFSNAINFNKNKKYLPYALIPLLFILFFYISGNSDVISNSFARVVQYDKNFEKPAAFKFEIVSNDLHVEQNKSFKLLVKTVGKIIPENASIIINNEEYFLETISPGNFSYQFDNVQKDITFHFKSNEITSNDYVLNVVNVPTISSFTMQLHFPSYLGKKPEVIQGTGNAVIPEGTLVTWNLNTLATTTVNYNNNSLVTPFSKNENQFSLTKRIVNNTDYQISISNKQLKNHENLQYKLTILKDQFPSISATETPDSLKLKQKVIIGQVSDDYGLSKLQVVFYDRTKPNIVYRKGLTLKSKVVDQFVYSFPDVITLQPGVNYDYYFEVFDNDVVNGLKSSKSTVFSHSELTQEQKEQKSLQEQQSNINSLQKALDNQDKQFDELEKLKKLDKQKDNLDYKDQKKIQDFINRQKQQDEMMKEFSEKMKENLEQFKPEQKDEMKQELLNRLEKNEKDAAKNEKLLKELEELTKKLEKEELFDKADKLKQQAKTQQKSLEQLVELTKRYYVEQKAEQLADKLDKLSDKQDKLGDKDNQSKEEQVKLSKEFDDLKKELDDLEKENKELKSPMDIPNDKGDQKEVDQDQQKAEDNLEKKDTKSAKKNQKAAAQKMKEMSKKMSQSMAAGEMEENAEDAKVLRQILDNLLSFSFDQEKLMQQFKSVANSKSNVSSLLKKQQDLKTQFKHVDDSLFALSMRQPKLSDLVLKEVEEIHYNLDKSIENLVATNRGKGISHQQFTLSSANKLADMLSNVQNDMNMSMSSSGGAGKPKPGQGKGGKQLADIISQQKGLGDKMKDGQPKPGDGKKPGDGQKPGQGKKPGEQGEGGSQGIDGKDGEGDAGKLLEIIKEQQELRESLEKELEKNGMGGNGQNAVKQMKDLEKQLINKGLTQENINRAMQINHELLKLETAMKQQGQDSKRESNTNKKDFLGTNKPLPPALLNYLKSVEILNRQSLPLQPNFNNKVQQYFKTK
ncbi:DUF4175 family protein [Flavobacterium urocaniciphilum]|uniref:Glutamyl-tRNA synthetase n=1 Tax=Flavobacterium urocaniciphilum TaxID=1299341 RepID=A0A1H9BT99_9FLAO|nr:DUF4175 family protein [Flavobacterium urocaniciphilum]SEP92182.1 hypothetical protein SAMN05444005_103202 [Flavobacterium urocaniciphilum]